MRAPLESNASYVAASETNRKKRHTLRRRAGYLLPSERVKGCGRKRTGQTVDLHRSGTGAHFVGVETCGSVWHCPVCAAKISEKRRCEVAHAMDYNEEHGGAAYMLTLTMRHSRGDKLAKLKAYIADGWRKVQNRRAYRNIKAQCGFIGSIRAIEVTHSENNGWHPHLHVLILTKQPLDDVEGVEGLLFGLWVDVLAKTADRYVSLDALDFRPATSSDYVTKWGADRELVKGQQKEGCNSLTPWQLLDASNGGNKRAGQLFKEYARVFKGAQQLTWTKGLKSRFNIGEVSDEVVAENETEAAADTLPSDDNLPNGRIGTLDKHTFDEVVRRNLTAEVLNIAHASGWAAVIAFLKRHGIYARWPHSDEIPSHDPPERSPPGFADYWRVHGPDMQSGNSGFAGPDSRANLAPRVLPNP